MNLTIWKSEEVMFKLAPENTQELKNKKSGGGGHFLCIEHTIGKGSESRKNRNTKDLKRTLKYERDTENYRNTGRDSTQSPRNRLGIQSLL